MSKRELNGLEHKVKGAIWTYFFRSNPDMTGLVVEDVQLEAPNQGSARLLLSRGDLQDQFQVRWEIDQGSILVDPRFVMA